METKLYNYWNEIGLKYADEWQFGGQRYISFQEQKFIEKSLKNFSDSKITALDIGCGTGRILSVLESSPKIEFLYALDFNKSMLDYCRRRFRNSKKIKKFIQADISQKLPFKDGTFDLITGIRVLKYSQNWSEILNECYRILKKDGVLTFEMPNKFSVNKLARYNIDIFSASEKELKSILKQIGFNILEIKGGPVLPSFIYNVITNKILSKAMQKIENIIKSLLGEISFSRFIYISCVKV